jgi:septum formation protein
LEFTAIDSKVDESVLKQALIADQTAPADIALALAAEKARAVAAAHAEAWVLGSDQVLSLNGELFSKPRDPHEACAQLQKLSGRTHELTTATVILVEGAQKWSNQTKTEMTMRVLSPTFIQSYVARNWHSIRWSVGGYKIEEEGARLFEKIDGDYFNVLGMPLLDILTFLEQAGVIEQ